MFIKVFIDLTNKGFLKSDASDDITSVNNKVVMGIKNVIKHLRENKLSDYSMVYSWAIKQENTSA